MRYTDQRSHSSTGVGTAAPHESALEHSTGEALYTDDLAGRYPGVVHAYPVLSPVACGRVTRLDADPALLLPGVLRVLTAADVPGVNDGGVKHDEPLFPSEVRYHNQALAWVLAESEEEARLGAEAVAVEIDEAPALVDLREAMERGSFQGATLTMRRGDLAAGFAEADLVVEGESECGGQEHFYLETHNALAMIDEAGQLLVHSSTQHPSETQEIVSHVLGLPAHRVTVQQLRMGGGFGGKEMQPHGLAAVAALGALLLGRPVRLRLPRALDLTLTGKRHPYVFTWKAGVRSDGTFTALEARCYSDGGWSLDLSEPIMARTLCHVDNAYYLPNVHVVGTVCRTNKTSQTAFRGFGGPQGMFLIEDIIGRLAPRLGIAPDVMRERNFYGKGQTTPYGQPVRHALRVRTLWDEVRERSEYPAWRADVDAFNAAHDHVKRGLALTPVKFGVSFNFTSYNQAGALVHVYKDGSVLINHGGTEMGQGLHTKMLQVAASALGVPRERVRLAPTRTDKVPNTSATAASSGADLNGGAVLDACRQISERLAEVASGVLGCTSEDVLFEDGVAFARGRRAASLGWDELVSRAYLRRVQLWSDGFYRTPGLQWDASTMTGTPFRYFAYGVAATEVEVDAFTGATRVRRADIVHDVGDSLSPVVDRGQVEGAFVQGLGWLLLEELRWDARDGRLLTRNASTYKLPSLGEMPERFTVHLMERAAEPGVVYGSKAVGEPPFMLALSAREAVRDAISQFGGDAAAGLPVEVAAPSTPEAVYWAIQSRRAAGEAP
ncbi:xanthine dehydrogenase molybdopterin binding subunit [Micrococcales bacterium 31B]|nr:xanthine dehydrogenase molybdopterin binding subunit [Micrococcales bacterium 31B]